MEVAASESDILQYDVSSVDDMQIKSESRVSILQMDYRMQWIQDRVLKFMGLPGQEHLFYELTDANNRFLEDKLLNFLILDFHGETSLERKLMCFYKTYITEIIQKEVTVWEESKLSQLSSASGFPGKGKRMTKSAPGKVEIEDKREKKGGKKGKKAKAKFSKTISSPISSRTETSITLHSETTFRFSEDETEDAEEEDGKDDNGSGDFVVLSKKSHSKSAPTDSSSFVPPPGEEDKYVPKKKIVDEERETPVLHMICGAIDGNRADFQDTTFYYFLRTSDFGIPPFESYDECLAEIPKYLIVGSIQGKFLDSLNRLLTQVFRPLVVNQFRGTRMSKQFKFEGSESEAQFNAEGKSKIVESREAVEEVTESPEIAEESEISMKREKTILKKDTKKDSASASVRISSKSSTKAIKKLFLDPAIEQTKKDILDLMDKLISNVQWTLENVEGDILLRMPKIPELSDPFITEEMLMKNDEIIKESEETVLFWISHIEKILDSYTAKVPQGKGPMDEWFYWHDREAGLSMLVEQLKIPTAKKILGLMAKIDSSVMMNFNYYHEKLWKHYVEARDNIKFLDTVSRLFKLITESDCFKKIAHAIPSLTESLRMIWVLSRYYSFEDKMVGLFERISWQLCENVKKNLSIDQLFKKPLEKVLQKTAEAHALLKKWKTSYLKTREDIEFSGKGARWEFDQTRLFRRTEYIAIVSSGLNEIASVLQDFSNIFGADLKSIIYDPAQIDTIVKRIDKLILPVQEADFNIFDEFNKENWEAAMTRFYEEVHYLENEARYFIDQCFMVLINAEDALQMLLKFTKVKTRAAIQERLSSKFDVIMQQFSKEISTVESIYNRGKRNPPLLTYHPPMAGAIFWVRQLFHRLRRPVLIFQKVDELKHSELKLLAFSQYYDIVKQLKAYEEGKFSTWVNKAQTVLTSTMKKSVLKLIRVERGRVSMTAADEPISAALNQVYAIHASRKGKNDYFPSLTSTPRGSVQRADIIFSKMSDADTTSTGMAGSKVGSLKGLPRSEIKEEFKATKANKGQGSFTISSSMAKQGIHTGKMTWTEFMKESILVENQLRFQVNFNWEIFEIIREAELMERLGFELPAIVRDACIQKDRLRVDIEATEKMVNQYNTIIDEMDEGDIQLLKTTLQNVEKNIQPGVMRFNWNSLSVEDYANKCGTILKNLTSIVGQVNQMKKDLDNRIENELQSYFLFSADCESEGNLLPCKTYFLEIQNRRTELVTSMKKTYQSTTPMLIKLESLVLGSSTGRTPAMQLLYEKYEKKIFNALLMCYTRNLDLFNKRLSGNKPIFQIDAVLIASEVVLRPSPMEIYNTILPDVKNMVESLKVFNRWLNGTCIECKPQKEKDNEEYTIFTFFVDIISIQVVNELILNIQDTAYKLASDCTRYLHRWKKYSNLWSFDKNLACEKFSATEPTLLQYDEKFTFYGGILEELVDMDTHYDLFSIRINLRHLLLGIEQHAKEWKQVLGNHLLTKTIQGIADLKTMIEQLRSEVELVITGLDRFTLIMQAISDVKKNAIQAEIRYSSYQETFQTLRSHGIAFSESDEEMAYSVQRDWESLYLGALYRASTLESTCDRFSEMTQDQIEQFLAELKEFAEDFEANGPGSVEEDLELGLKKMDEYAKLIDKYEEKRQALLNSELLFDLPATDYTIFLKVKVEFEGMKMIYRLYKQQKFARDGWAKTLWVNLNPQQLIEGMEQFIREFRKFPKPVRNLNVGRAVEANMKSFKNSVPLFIELKNEAMRERHWKELMRLTGQYFDMNPDRSEDK